MNNAVIGKTMENLRKSIRVELVRGCEMGRMCRHVADPAYLSHKIFDGKPVATHSSKSKLKLNRPTHIDQGVLYLPKHLMHDFWYSNIKARYGDKASLLVDIDSLLFQV